MTGGYCARMVSIITIRRFRQVRQLIIDGVKEIVTNYEVDGIHFDDYFYPNLDDSKAETWFDYPEYQAGGTSLSVAAWRRNNVNELVRGVYSAVKSIRPQALFGISRRDIYRTSEKIPASLQMWMRG